MKLSPEALAGIMRLLAEASVPGVLHLDDWSNPARMRQEWAWVAQIMRGAEDYARFFPKGKWATIQAVEQQLQDYVKPLLKPAILNPRK